MYLKICLQVCNKIYKEQSIKSYEIQHILRPIPLKWKKNEKQKNDPSKLIKGDNLSKCNKNLLMNKSNLFQNNNVEKGYNIPPYIYKAR